MSRSTGPSGLALLWLTMSLSNGTGFEGMKKLAKQISALVLGLGLATPLYAAEVINNVSSSASTGDNSVSPADSTGSSQGGTVIEGESKASVKIYTEVDGEVVEDIDETVTLPAGESAVIKKSTEVNLSGVHSTTSVEAQVEAPVEKPSSLLAFLNKIFKYVFSIFKFS